MTIKAIRTAVEAFKYLDGVVCMYRPANSHAYHEIKKLLGRLCNDLNSMKTRPPSTMVELRRVPLESGEESGKYLDPGFKVVSTVPDGQHQIQIIKRPNYADDPRVIGPRYTIDMFKFMAPHMLDKASGVQLVGIGRNGHKEGAKINGGRWLSTYIVTGKFGGATQSCFDDGKYIEKATYHKIDRRMLDRIVTSMQATHQRSMFEFSGIRLDTQRAYDLAIQGMPRPIDETNPVIYSMKCVGFNAPFFDLEIKCINETEGYLAQIIHNTAYKLHSAAACSSLRCIQHGPFTLKDALLLKQAGVENVIQNIMNNSTIIKEFNLNVRNPLLNVAGHVEEGEVVEEAEVEGGSFSPTFVTESNEFLDKDIATATLYNDEYTIKRRDNNN